MQLLVRAYQVRGHHVAELDPLGILDADLADVQPPELELSRYGFTERDLDKEITLGPGILPHFATEGHKTMKLRAIIKLCKRIYCQSLYLFDFHMLHVFIRRCCWYPVCSHSRQGAMRLDSRASRDSQAVELYR